MTTITHGTNSACPDVQAGRASRCPGHESVEKVIRGIPYCCQNCGGIQFDTAYSTSGPLMNCNQAGCEGDQIEVCGPLQKITVILYPER